MTHLQLLACRGDRILPLANDHRDLIGQLKYLSDDRYREGFFLDKEMNLLLDDEW